MQKINFESGRSMVEMLGTLAIVGVLSVGGIAGYSYGMDKYRANETINDVNLRGIDLVAQVSVGRTTLSLSEWPKKSKAGYDISAPSLSIEGDAYFTISGIPKRVCEMVYEGIMQNQTTDVEINGYVVDDSSSCGDDNTMGFFFITNAGEGGTNPEDLCKDITCPEGSSCTHGICMGNMPPIEGTNYLCRNDNDCGECKYCNTYGWCSWKNNGTRCGNNLDKMCQNGSCIDNKICTNNSNCDNGYYCGKLNGTDENKTCIKAEFHKATLSTNEVIYLSKEKYYIASNYTEVKNMLENAENMCQAIGKNFINNYESRGDIVEHFSNSFSSSGDYIEVLSASQACTIYPNSLYCSSYNSAVGIVICVDENKISDNKEPWETTTKNVTTTQLKTTTIK